MSCCNPQFDTINRIGWSLQTLTFAIKAGSSGKYQIVLGVTEADGTALADYDGWTATLELFADGDASAAISKTPAVTGDAIAKTLTFDLLFAPADTADIEPGTLRGSIWLAHPSDSQAYSPARIVLEIQAHD